MAFFKPSIKLLTSYLLKYKKWGFLGGFFLLLNVFSLLPVPLITMHIIDKVIPAGDIHTLSLLILIGVGILIFSGIASNIQNYYFTRFNTSVVYSIQIDLLKIIQNTNSQYRNKTQTGYLMSRIIDDPNRLGGLFADTYVNIIKDIITLIVGCVILLFIHWKIALLTFVLLPLFISALKIFGVKIKNMSYSVYETNANLVKKVQESVSILDTFLLHNANKKDLKKVSNVMQTNIKEVIKRSITQGIAGSTIGLISGLGPFIILWFGVNEILNGNLTLGELIAFNTFIGYVFGPTSRLVNTYLNMQQSFAAWDRVYEIFTQTPQIESENIEFQKKELLFSKDIVFAGVSIKFEDTKVIENLNLTIKKNETLAIVGESGSGKSTLVKLIPKLNIATEGSIFINNIEINKIHSSDIRSQIGFVQQETVLFVDTIKNNIALAKESLNDEEVVSAAKTSGIHNFIMSLPEQYNTMIDERGLNMSVGQKQRLGIARSIVINPQLFILDEPTSNLDAETETKLFLSLERFMKERTTIIIAHRLSTIKFADKIIVMEKGRIIETGTHKELLEKKGKYFQLWDLQIKNN